MAKAKLTSARLAPDVRLGATRTGLMILSPTGCFRISGPSADFFVSALLPALHEVELSSSLSAVPGEFSAFIQTLSSAGIVECSSQSTPSDGTIRIAKFASPASVVLVRRTRMTDLVADLLMEKQIRILDDANEDTLVFADFAGLDSVSTTRLAYDLHQGGCRSISFWRHGPETFYGPFVRSGRTACWSCFQRRFSDSLSNGDGISCSDDLASAKIITDNLLLALRYPDTVPYGCVLVDNGEVFTAHSVLPVPWCEVCNFDDLSNGSPVALAHSVYVPEDFRSLADSRGGIVRHVFLFETDGSDVPTVPSCCSVRIAPPPNATGQNPEIRGEGKGAIPEDAVRSAIGEGLERYAASLWHPSELVFSSFNELHRDAFDPRWLVLYDDEQRARPGFPYARFDPDRPLHWKAGKWLDTGQAVYLPAISTYMNFPVAPADCFTQTTSNGLAAGATLDDATLRALYELIERDAFMLFWLAHLPALPIEIDGSDELVQRALAGVAQIGARTELYCIDAGTGHPTVVCIGLGDGESWPGVTIGLGTHANIDVALRKAVFEHNHYGSYMRQLMLSGDHKKIRGIEDVEVALDHGLYYLDPAHADALDAFRAGRKHPTHLTDLRSKYCQPASVSACVSCLAEAGVRAAAVDVTSPDVRLGPVRVARAFGTWMQPIYFGATTWRLNNPRLQRLLVNGANTTPHPLA